MSRPEDSPPKRTGVGVRLLRYYKQEGLLESRRRPSGDRDYDKEDGDVARRIRLLSEARLKLDFIRRFLPCVRGDAPEFEPCSDLLVAMRREIDCLDRHLASFNKSRRVFDGYLPSMTK